MHVCNDAARVCMQRPALQHNQNSLAALGARGDSSSCSLTSDTGDNAVAQRARIEPDKAIQACAVPGPQSPPATPYWASLTAAQWTTPPASSPSQCSTPATVHTACKQHTMMSVSTALASQLEIHGRASCCNMPWDQQELMCVSPTPSRGCRVLHCRTRSTITCARFQTVHMQAGVLSNRGHIAQSKMIHPLHLRKVLIRCAVGQMGPCSP